ncbi:chemotaxis protein CheW [Photobacterium sanguinicancri]|nr:chemotaxis protein CheW [Photobacterium sanguinicancri]
MSDKKRLSSEQALDDYFFDLLIEPEEELEAESTIESEADTSGEIESQLTELPADIDVTATDSDESDNIGVSDDVVDQQPGLGDWEVKPTDDLSVLPAQVDGSLTNYDQKSEDNSQVVDSLDDFVDDLALEMSASRNADYDFSTIELTHSTHGKIAEDAQASNTHHDDGEVLASQSLADDSTSVNLEVNVDGLTPSLVSSFSLTQHCQSQASNWVPSVQRVEARNLASFTPVVMEHTQPDMQGVQRLLDQMVSMQTAIQQDSDALIDNVTEAEFLAAAQDDVMLAEPEPEPEIIEQVEETPSVATDTVANLSVNNNVESQLATQVGSDIPPEKTAESQLGSEFQALFFEACGVTFAVSLTELGGIHQMGELNHLLGRPEWYLGLLTSRELQHDVVDTARWVMPEKLSSDEHKENYRYIVMLGESKWGLACDKLHGTETLTKQSIRWREKVGKRPWLAGMVKEKMCALIHVEELIKMLNAGLDVKGIQ